MKTNSFFLQLGLFFCIFPAMAAEVTDAEWAQLKRQARDRKRQVIYNTDGCDAVYYPRKLEASKENFIKQRLGYALGSKIDAISYCPLSSGFGYLTSKTEVGDQLLIDPPHAKNKRNVTGELLQLGTDPLKIAEEFCRKNNFEFFVSLRCNDTHDMSHRKDKPYFLFPPYKEKHPEYLLGSYTKRPPHCNWSAVDFTHQAIRDRFLAIIRELMTNYEADGLELDFCRHLQYFKSVAWGKSASANEVNLMNDCLREIRAMTEKIGRRRKRPILISVRLPDSAAYCKAVGLDVEKWMQEKWIDMYIGSFYFRLNPWETSVKLCHKYGVKFYPSMDESRIYKTAAGFQRNHLDTDRARQAAALRAGVDGISYFNREGADPLRETMRGKMDDVRLENKRYFVSYRHRSPKAYLKDGDKYSNLPGLSNYSTVQIFPGRPQQYTLEVGDDFNHPEVKSPPPVFTAYAETDSHNGKRLILKVNGKRLPHLKTKEAITTFAAPLDYFKPGVNQLEVGALPAAGKEEQPMTIMSGKRLLTGRVQAPWRRLFVVHDYPNSEKIVDDAYRINDSGTKENEFANLLYPMGSLPAENLRVKFHAKVESSSTPLGAVCRMADGKNVEIIALQPDRITLHFNGKSIHFNTSDRFHAYDASMVDGHLSLKVDGKELLKEKLTMSVNDKAGELKNYAYNIKNMHRQSLLFGSLAGTGTGTSLWKNVQLVGDGSGVFLKDLKFELAFEKESHLNRYGGVKPEWSFRFDATAGTVPKKKTLRNAYLGENLKVVERAGKNIFSFDNSAGNQAVFVNDDALSKTASGILLAEWKIKHLGAQPGKSSFQVVLKPASPRGDVLVCNVAIAADEAMTPWGVAEFPTNIRDCWATFRLALDVEKSVAALWLDGKKIGEGKVSARSGIAPGIFFGDGSGSVGGNVELEFLKITRLN